MAVLSEQRLPAAHCEVSVNGDSASPAGVVVHVALDIALGFIHAPVHFLLVCTTGVAADLCPSMCVPCCNATQPAETLHGILATPQHTHESLKAHWLQG